MTAAARTRAIVRRGMADQRRSILVWGASLGAFGVMIVAIYPSIKDSLAEIAEQYPAGLKEAFGVETMSTVEGYVHAELYSLLVPLAIGFFAVRAMAGPVAGAEERGQLDLLLGLPLPRRSLLAGAFLVSCMASGAVVLMMSVITLIAGAVSGADLPVGAAAAGAAGVWGLAVLGAGLSAAACGAMHRGRAVIGAGMGAFVAMYVVDIAGRLSEPLEPLRWASAFRYYGQPMVDGLDVPGLLVLLAAGLALGVAGTAAFERRDVLA